jgi:preprotein translocase subunit SecG
MLQTILLALHVLVAIALIAFILLQQGRGASTGASFGGGASGTVFGARGTASFLSRTTAILATVFLANCLVLAFLAAHQKQPLSLIDRLASTSTVVAPPAAVTPAPATPTTSAPQVVEKQSPAPVTAPDMPKIPSTKP